MMEACLQVWHLFLLWMSLNMHLCLITVLREKTILIVLWNQLTGILWRGECRRPKGFCDTLLTTPVCSGVHGDYGSEGKSRCSKSDVSSRMTHGAVKGSLARGSPHYFCFFSLICWLFVGFFIELKYSRNVCISEKTVRPHSATLYMYLIVSY